MQLKIVSLFCCVLLLSCFNRVQAQVGLAGGFAYGMPVIIGSSVAVTKPSVGAYGAITYCPPGSKIFPSFSYLYKNMLLPVRNTLYKDQDDFATCRNFMLGLNYKTGEGTRYHVIFINAGVAGIVPQPTLADDQGNDLQLRDTGSITIYPVVQAGYKYVSRILPNGNFYLELEGNITYIRMHSDNVYYLWQGNNATPAHIGGDIISPAFQIALHYMFGREDTE